jgi:hypothetical protein
MVLEALAILRFVRREDHNLRNRRVTFLCDNQAVKWALVKGWSKNRELSDIVADIIFLCNELGCDYWVHYVGTKRNPADTPSRPSDADPSFNEFRRAFGVKRFWQDEVFRAPF